MAVFLRHCNVIKILAFHWLIDVRTQWQRHVLFWQVTGNDSLIQNMAVRSGRVPSSTCYCPTRRAAQVHCFCVICNGKAVNYRTQISHLNLSAFCDEVTPTILEEETVVENEIRLDHEETGVDDHDPDRIEGMLFSLFKYQNFIVKKLRISASLRKDKMRRPVDLETYFRMYFFLLL